MRLLHDSLNVDCCRPKPRVLEQLLCRRWLGRIVRQHLANELADSSSLIVIDTRVLGPRKTRLETLVHAGIILPVVSLLLGQQVVGFCVGPLAIAWPSLTNKIRQLTRYTVDLVE